MALVEASWWLSRGSDVPDDEQRSPRIEDDRNRRGVTTPSPQVDCSETLSWLYEFLDGELTDDRRRAIETHLNFCPPCGSAVTFEAELRRVIADRAKDHVPEQLRSRIATALAELGDEQDS